MEIRALNVPDCLEFVPLHHRDERGEFLEWFRADELQSATGRRFDLQKANLSVSVAGVVRGIHFSDVPPGQGKYVVAMSGHVTDYVVDLRVGSPTFGVWDAVELDTERRSAVFLPEGIGHAFWARTDATVAYLTTDVYKPAHDRTISPLDAAIGLPVPAGAKMSPKDEGAPTLAEAGEQGWLPSWDTCQTWYREVGR